MELLVRIINCIWLASLYNVVVRNKTAHYNNELIRRIAK